MLYLIHFGGLVRLGSRDVMDHVSFEVVIITLAQPYRVLQCSSTCHKPQSLRPTMFQQRCVPYTPNLRINILAQK